MTVAPTSPPRTAEPLRVMSFGEHLEELRMRVLRALLVTLVGTCIALFFGDELMHVIAGPHQAAMSRVLVRQRADQAAEDLAELGKKLGELAPGTGFSIYREHEQIMRLRQGDAELRQGLSRSLTAEVAALLMQRVDAATLVVERSPYYGRMVRASEQIAAIEGEYDHYPHASLEALQQVVTRNRELANLLASWKEPVADAAGFPAPEVERRLHEYEGIRNRVIELENWRKFKPPLKTLSYPEAFFSYLKICILTGLLLGLPWITVEIWGFISAGLYKSERRAIYPFIPMSFGFFLAGVVFAYNVLIPVGLAYLGGYASPDVIEGNFTLRDYISLIMTMVLGMGLVFQLPLAMIFLVRAQMLTTAQYRQYRKISIFSAAVVGAMLTPPDPVTQLLMAVPLVLLYEAGIWGSVLFNRKKTAAGERA